jgi:putative heme-binding domain-containing protein
MWEMVYRVERGGNYGWSIVEGPQSVRPELTEGPTPILPPVISHSHIESRSMTGGFVYRGKRLKRLEGAYIYGDYVTGKIWALRYDGKQVTWRQELVDSTIAVIAFGEDREHELYVLDHTGGIYRLTPNDSARANQNFPRKLSETGLFSSVKDHRPAPGVIPYSINAQPWADGASAQRHVAIPGAPKLGLLTTSNTQKGNITGNWNYPTDTVFAKTLSLEITPGDSVSLRRLETQILHRDGDTWRAYTYIWNDDQSDAVLAPAEGADRTFSIRDAAAPGGRRQQTWHFASRTECLVCHTTRGGSIYGFVPPQLNKQHDYGHALADQLATLAHIGLFDDPFAKQPPNPEHRVGTIPNPYDESIDLHTRARAYLHVNCAQCHRRGGGGTAKFELLYHLDFDKLQLVGQRPSQGAFNIHGAENVAAGDPYRSVLYYRLAKLGQGHMPKIGAYVVDKRGLRLIHDWIDQMKKSTTDNDDRSTGKLRTEQLAALTMLAKGGGGADSTIDRLLSTTSGALLLLSVLDSGDISQPLAGRAIAEATVHVSGEIRGLYERFIPEEKRIKRLGSVVRPGDILTLAGNAESGKAVFFQTDGVQCKNCHQINKQGKEIGPDLSQIGKKYDRSQLLETILEPSKKIEKEFFSYLVETTAGRVHTGLLVKRTAEEIVLKDSEGKLVRIPAAEIELVAPQRKSLMPELLLREMTAQQVADLLAYLSTLK